MICENHETGNPNINVSSVVLMQHFTAKINDIGELRTSGTKKNKANNFQPVLFTMIWFGHLLTCFDGNWSTF